MFKPEKHLKNERNYDYEFLMITFAVAWSLGAIVEGNKVNLPVFQW